MKLPSERKQQDSGIEYVEEVFRELKKRVVPRKIILESSNQKLKKTLIVFYVVSFLLLAALFMLKSLFPSGSIIFTAIAVFVFLLIVLTISLIMLYFVIIAFTKEGGKSLKTSRFISNAKDTFIKSRKASKFAAVERDVILKSIELHFEHLYTKSQEAKEARVNIISVIVSLISVAFTVFIFPDFLSESKMVLIATCVGVFAGLTALVKPLLSAVEPHDKSIYENCLLELKQMRLENETTAKSEQ
ncbi:MAG: hypothetical protein ACFB4I_19295 [Cyanophyceae cyanobacterium]